MAVFWLLSLLILHDITSDVGSTQIQSKLSVCLVSRSSTSTSGGGDFITESKGIIGRDKMF